MEYGNSILFKSLAPFRQIIEYIRKLNYRIIFKKLSMNKAELQTLKKLKLEDYEIGRTLGKGNLFLLFRWFWKS